MSCTIYNDRKPRIPKFGCHFGFHETTSMEEEEGKEAIRKIAREATSGDCIKKELIAEMILATSIHCKHCRKVLRLRTEIFDNIGKVLKPSSA